MNSKARGEVLSAVVVCLFSCWTDGVLASGQSGYTPTRGTVTVGELSVEVEEKSLHLQEQGLEAFKHADYLAADSLLRQALDLTPSSATIYNNLGAVCLRQRRLDLAAGWLERALALAPQDPCIMGNLGIVRWLQYRSEESYRLLKLALVRGYTYGPGQYILGLLSLERGSTGAAIRHLSKASPNEFPERDLYLSVAYRKENRLKPAEQSYRKFLKRNPVPWISAAHY